MIKVYISSFFKKTVLGIWGDYGGFWFEVLKFLFQIQFMPLCTYSTIVITSIHIILISTSLLMADMKCCSGKYLTTGSLREKKNFLIYSVCSFPLHKYLQKVGFQVTSRTSLNTEMERDTIKNTGVGCHFLLQSTTVFSINSHCPKSISHLSSLSQKMAPLVTNHPSQKPGNHLWLLSLSHSSTLAWKNPMDEGSW